jgi:hypothetical protein
MRRLANLLKHRAKRYQRVDRVLKYTCKSIFSNYFKGMACLNSCKGHVAGYDWAESNEISSFDDCSSRSNSFTEGCQTYFSENILK